MGNLFVKPLTKEDLDTALTTALAPLNDSVLAPAGDRVSSAVTVSITGGGDVTPRGHGAVIEIDSQYYLLSAAHVLVSFSGPNEQLTLSWNNGVSQVVVGQALYLPRSYVLSGEGDVACLLFQEVENAENRLATLSKSALQVVAPTAMTAGKTVVGHGKIFIRGMITSAGARFPVQAQSVPGCSGCPLFLNTKGLAGLVHGPNKHRAHVGTVGKISPTVYGDSVGDVQLLLVASNDTTDRAGDNGDPTSKRALLAMAENVSEQLSEELLQHMEGHEVSELRQALGVKGEISLKHLMGELEAIVWPPDSDVLHLELGGALICSTEDIS